MGIRAGLKNDKGIRGFFRGNAGRELRIEGGGRVKLCVIGNGMIVRRLLQDVRDLSEVEVTGICVRSASLEKGQALAEEFGIPAVYTDYGACLADGAFDTVYIGIANHLHAAYAKQALEAGKHVVCEKPFTLTAEEARELAGLAKARGLFLWEAFKIPYSPVFQAVQAHLDQVGRIRMVQCNYSRISSRYPQYERGEVHAAFDPSCGGGCLYDINSYNLHFVTALFGKPEEVRYIARRGFNGVDTCGTAILRYPDFDALCTGAKDSTSPCFAVIQGTKGYIRVEGPLSGAYQAELTAPEGTVCLAEDPARGTLTDEVREFARQLAAGDRDACYGMLEHSVLMMEVLEEAGKQG